MKAWRTHCTVVGGACTLVLIAFAVYAPRQAAAGWLIAFVAVSAVPLGSLPLLMIHNLTGGAWGDDLRPGNEPAAAGTLVLAPLFIPIGAALPLLYAWMPGTAHTPPDVAQLYLNAPLFVLRAVIAFAGWSVLAVLLPRATERRGVLLSGFGLIFHTVAVTLLATDWILSTEPVFTSSSFGATTVFIQLYAALAFAAVAGGYFRRSLRDLAGLLLAVALGTAYINFMAVLIIWYGDLPHKVAWFVERTPAPWVFVAVAAFFLGALGPILALLPARMRGSPQALRWVGATALSGIALYDVWLLAPTYGAGALIAAALAAIAIASALLLFATCTTDARRTFRWGAGHG
jgi:hypothetical protein